MTHPSATPDHLGEQQLADLQEDLLDRAASARAIAHLASCPSCAARRADLDLVRSQLRLAVAEDTSAPPDVVRRLDDALAGLAAPDEPLTRPATATVTPMAARRRNRSAWSTRGLQAAAVFVLLAAVAGIGYGAIHSSGGHADTAAGRSAGAADNGAEKGVTQGGSYSITSSGRNYTRQTLGASVPGLLAGTYARRVAPLASNPGTDSSEQLRNGQALAACIANISGGPVTPLAVELATFEGKPATIIVLPDPDNAAKVRVYAVEPACPTGTLLDFVIADRP